MEESPSFYSPGISPFITICFAAGIGIAIGMIAGTTGLEGSARGRMAVLAAGIGFLLGYFLTSALDGTTIIGAIGTGFFAAFACAVVSGVIAGATRRGGTAALAFLTFFGAIVIAVISAFFPPFAILPAGGLIWLAIGRRRRADRKHAGLRVLR
ncbi:MAG: hypothetical protein IPK93_04245 [Solirubrobacterales bacterium]|nr:hypothetical protein [Solirubrobacterales bacterium]